MPIDEVIRVSISEAAKLFGVNAQTIRRAIKSDELSYVVVQGRYKIAFESLLKWSQQHSTINNKMHSKGIGQYVDQWKIRNKIYAPNPEILKSNEAESGKNLNLFSIQPVDRLEVKPKQTEKRTTDEPAPQNPTLPL